MRSTVGTVVIASLLAAAGAARAQSVPVSADGSAPIQEWRLGPGERLTVGTPGGPVDPRLSEVFVPAGSAPEADSHSSAVFLPDGSGVVVANRASRNLTIFDPQTRALIRAIPLSGSPQSVAVTPDGTRAVVANLFESTASIVDLGSGAETVIPVGANPVVARVSPDGTRAVVSSNGPQELAVIDLASGAVVRTIATGGYQTTFSANFESQGIGFRSTGPVFVDNATVLYPDYDHSRVLRIDLDSGATTPIATGANPTGIVTVGGAAGKAYVSHYYPTRQVSEIDLATNAVSRTFTGFGADTQGPLAVNPAGTRLVVAVQNACQVVDLATGAISGLLSTASVNDLVTTSDGNYAVGVGYYGSVISFATQSIVGNPNQFVSCSIGAASPVGSRVAMFSDTFGEDMVVIDASATPALLSAGPTGPAPEGDKTRVVTFTPDGSKAIAVNQFSQTATIVDTATQGVLAIVPTGRRPGNAAVTPDGSKAVIANRDGTTATVVDLSTYGTTEAPISTRGDQVQISPDGRYAYIAVVVSDGVWKIDLTTNSAVGGRLATGDMGSYFQNYSQFSGMTLSHDGATLVTCNTISHSASIIDTASWTVVATLPFGSGNSPARAVFSPDDSRIYMTLRDTDRVAVITNAGAGSGIAGYIAVGDSPIEMVMNADGSRLYVQNTGTPTTIGVVDTAAMAQVATITGPANTPVDGLALAPAGDRLYVSRSNGAYTISGGGFSVSQSQTLSVYDTATHALVDSVSGANLAAGLAIAPNGSWLGMPNLMSEGLTLIALAPAPPACYANCDQSTTAPVLNVLDFNCFLNRFSAGCP